MTHKPVVLDDGSVVIPVVEAKQNFCSVLKLVNAGARIVITNRRVPIVELVGIKDRHVSLDAK